MGDVFNQAGDLVSQIPEGILNRHLKTMVEDFMLPGKAWEPPPENTRTHVGEYLARKHNELIKAKARGGVPASVEPMSPSGPNVVALPVRTQARIPTSPPSAEFFENLWWKVQGDDRLSRLCGEIKRIRYKETPMAASMLLRALLETSLEYHLEKINKKATYSNKYKHRTLASLLAYCANPTNAVFAEPRVAKQLGAFQQTPIKDHLDCVVHNKFGDVTIELLNLVRPYCKPIIEYIVQHAEGYR